MAHVKRRRIVLPTLMALAGFAVLIGLGSWQLERKQWKDNLVAALTARLSAPPGELPARGRWPGLNSAEGEFRRVAFAAEFLPAAPALVYAAAGALRPDVAGQGYWVFAPARLPDGGVVVINRGFLPGDRKSAASRLNTLPGGAVEIVGLMRWPERRGLFTPADDPRDNVWHLRDPRSIADSKGWGVIAPFYIEMESPPPAGGLPRVGSITTVRLASNHLQYAIAWFGLAAALAGVYLVWLRGQWRH
jgi:surfeit locus 1 family protein